jgi:DNA-binding response OmpR family regulator
MKNTVPVKIKLNVKDELLAKALKIMVREVGYEIAECGTQSPYVITDTLSDTSEKATLYVLREEIKGKLCLVRPFDAAELKGLLDRLISEELPVKKRENKALVIDKKHLTVSVFGYKIQLTEKEMQLFLLLYGANGRTVSDDEIVSTVWKNETVSGSNIAAVYVNYLRKKLDDRLGKKLIYRARGEGYVLKINEEEQIENA